MLEPKQQQIVRCGILLAILSGIKVKSGINMFVRGYCGFPIPRGEFQIQLDKYINSGVISSTYEIL